MTCARLWRRESSSASGGRSGPFKRTHPGIETLRDAWAESRFLSFGED